MSEAVRTQRGTTLGMIHYEWLVNLESLLGRGEFWFEGFPLRWAGGTGSPVRALAEVAS